MGSVEGRGSRGSERRVGGKPRALPVPSEAQPKHRHHPAQFVRLREDGRSSLRAHDPDAHRDGEMSLDLAQGTMRDGEELLEFLPVQPRVSLRDVRGYRVGCAAQLITQDEPFLARKLARDSVHVRGEIDASLPDPKVSEGPDSWHLRPLVAIRAVYWASPEAIPPSDAFHARRFHAARPL